MRINNRKNTPKAVIIGLVSVALLFVIIVIKLVDRYLVYNNSIVVHIKYDIDGKPIDYNSETRPVIGIGDGCETCKGRGWVLESEKLYRGYDTEKMDVHYIYDVCQIGDMEKLFFFQFIFLNEQKHWEETVYVHFISDDEGGLHSEIECENNNRIEMYDSGTELYYRIYIE